MFCAINSSIYNEVEKFSLLFKTAIPFPHVVIDNFLNESVADELLKDFPEISAMHRSNHFLFTNKYESSLWRKISDSFCLLNEELLSNKFQLFTSEIFGDALFMDSNFYGDIHQGVNKSFLDMHTDFNLHPYHKTWQHRLNVIIYLNKNWKQEYAGNLRLRRGLKGDIYEISPLFNRCVIMLLDNTTYHGYNQMILPKDISRKSIVAQFYKEELPNKLPPRRTTTWGPDQTDSFKWFAAKLYNPVTLLKTRIFR